MEFSNVNGILYDRQNKSFISCIV